MTDRETKIRNVLIGLLVSATLIAMTLVFANNNLRKKLSLQENVNEYLFAQVGEISAELENTRSALSQIEIEYASLSARYTELDDQHSSLQTNFDTVSEALAAEQERLGVTREQKYYLADVVDWLGRGYLYLDLDKVLRLYTSRTGLNPPRTCEPVDPARYLRWGAQSNSSMYVITPEKIGWNPYVYWSVRENVVFGPDHWDHEGYVGSRGYEFRYPLIPGTRFQQEVHTTINVYEHQVSVDVIPFDRAEMLEVELECGVIGYIHATDDADLTKTIYFPFGYYDVNVKLKFDDDLDRAIPVLTQAANLVIMDLTNGW